MAAISDVQLISNPRTDLAFHDYVTRTQRQADSPARLERLLRRRYPHAVVEPRDPMPGHVVVWYVYREGSWATD